MRWKKIAFPNVAAQIIRWDRVAELKCAFGLLAEEDHVSELGFFFSTSRFFAEDTARGEDSLDSADNKACWIESQVTGIVLRRVN